MGKENYTAYAKVDPNNRYTVTSNNIDVAGLLRNESAWVVDDKGVNHFNGDLEHLVDTEVNSSDSNAIFVPWMLANKVDDWNGVLSDAGEDFLALMCIRAAIRVQECIGTSLISDEYLGVFTTYYHKLKRNEAIGTYGQLQCFIYSDSERTSLLDTLSLTLRAKNDFQYVYGVNSANNATTPSITGSVSNLDLQEVVPPPATVIQKIAGIFGIGRLGLR